MTLATKAPDDYVEQDGCYNCNLVFCMSDYDCGNTYFCTYNAPKRPLCNSVAMGEYNMLNLPKEEEYRPYWGRGRIARMRMEAIFDDTSAYDVWDKWRKGREVKPWGKCPQHERKA